MKDILIFALGCYSVLDFSGETAKNIQITILVTRGVVSAIFEPL